MNSGKKDKRSEIRIPLISQKVTMNFVGFIYEREVDNICGGGMLVKLQDKDILPRPKVRGIAIFKLPGNLGEFHLHGYVLRVDWKPKKDKPKSFVFRFDAVTSGNQKILSAFMVYLRNKQIIAVSKRIIAGLFGKEKPKA